MYAVIQTGGKQYRVELGSEILVNRMQVEPGSTLEIDQVLLVSDGETASIGSPMVAGALVRADVVRQDRGEKIHVFKYKPKARRRVKQGHRQDLTVLRIADIQLDGRSAAEDAKKAQEAERREREKAERQAAAQAAADKALADKLAGQAEAARAAEKAATTKKPARAAKPPAEERAEVAETKPRRTRKVAAAADSDTAAEATADPQPSPSTEVDAKNDTKDDTKKDD